MKNLIKEQLQKVKAVNIVFNDNTYDILIPKTISISNRNLQKNKVYLIEISNSILHPAQDSLIASNWNKGIVPKYKNYKIELIDTIGDMIKVNGIAVDNGKDLLNEQFYGWLPENGFKVISSLQM